MKKIVFTLLLSIWALSIKAADVFVETESFANKGGWVVDQQFMDLMGSPYLLAHGMGTAVSDASTTVSFPESGTYYIYARTFNWTSPWSKEKGPGKFNIKINSKKLSTILGDEGNQWYWQKVGKTSIKKGDNTIALHDLTGFDGRCDAIFFTTDENNIPPADTELLADFRQKYLPQIAQNAGEFDFVVVGAGTAGMCAAIAAARNGSKVALINDRPLLGGNNSSEIRVHLGGRIAIGPYPNLGNILKEFGQTREGNAKPADYYEDQKKMDLIAAEKNITLFINTRANAVTLNSERNKIETIQTQNIETGEKLLFKAPVFADCTGDGTIGYLAGADFRMGREGRDEFGESIAPEKADKMTMGASIQWYSVKTDNSTKFPEFNYGMDFTDQSCEKVTMGEWTWETGMNKDQVFEAETIRDYGLLVVYANWSYLKNKLKNNDSYQNRKLGWVAYIAGKRESRRLLGDYILKEDDIVKNVFHEDATASTSWTIDLHFPDPANTKHFPGQEFKAETEHVKIYPYPVPYRCLYSRNINNLFMAGRNISVTHVALGTTRVMRTTAMLGEVVGLAASICTKNKVMPRQVYFYHLDDLKTLMETGAGKQNIPNNQQFNMGDILNKPNKTN